MPATNIPREKAADTIAAARRAQGAWADVPVAARLRIVRAFRHALAEQAPTLGEAVARPLDVPTAEVLAAEVVPLANACRFLERQAPAILATRRIGAVGRPLWLRGSRAEVRREPHGVVLVLGPANYPLFLPGVQVLQALVAGNAVLLKPGNGGETAAGLLAELLHASGLPAGLLQVLPATVEAGQDAIAAGVDRVLLTGSAASGRAVLRQLADPLIPAVLELSGCDAAFIREDADIDLVVRAMTFAFTLRRGATCIAPRRLFVARSVAGEVERRLTQAVASLRHHVSRTEAAAEAAALVREAVAEGARLCGGALLPDDNGMSPLLLADVSTGMAILREALFAPVALLIPVADDDEALELNARCPYALGATVFGSDNPARSLASRVRAGVVIVNDVIVPTADPRLPFGGRGESGYGITRGPEGLLDLTVPKVIITRAAGTQDHLRPETANSPALYETYLLCVHGRGLWNRLRAALRLVRLLVQPK